MWCYDREVGGCVDYASSRIRKSRSYKECEPGRERDLPGRERAHVSKSLEVGSGSG